MWTKRSVRKISFEIIKNLLRSHELISKIIKLPYYLILSPHEKVPVHLVKGTFIDASDKVEMLYAGSEHSVHQFSSLLFSQPFDITCIGEFPLRHVSSIINFSPPEVVAIRVKGLLSARYSKKDFLLLPNISFILDLRKPMEQIIQGMRRRRRRDLKKVKASNYTYAFYRKSSEMLDLFYRKMYLPYVVKRFAKAASIKSFLESEIIYRLDGGIVLVKKGKDPLAGILFQIQGKKILAWSLGVWEGNQKYIRASEAALFYLIQWAKSKGMNELDYGVSMPFLKEGIFIYKKEWGMIVREPNDQSFCALKLNSLTEGVMTFLEQNPFIIHDRGQIKGVILLSHHPNKDESKSLFSRYYLPELASLIIISYQHESVTRSHVKIDSRTSHDSVQGSTKPLQHICTLLREKGYQSRLTELRSMP